MQLSGNLSPRTFAGPEWNGEECSYLRRLFPRARAQQIRLEGERLFSHAGSNPNWVAAKSCWIPLLLFLSPRAVRSYDGYKMEPPGMVIEKRRHGYHLSIVLGTIRLVRFVTLLVPLPSAADDVVELGVLRLQRGLLDFCRAGN